jgi:Terminase large subunit, T4likevirus-type, N-terminal
MLIASDLRLALDASIIGDRVGLTLDPWQAELLRNRPKRSLLLCSRQSGKSTVCALTALHTAIYSPGSLTIIASPSQRQSAEMFRTVMGFRAKLDVPLAAESVLRAEFKNGSRIVALPGSEKTTRGYAGVSLCIIDEAARVEDELLAAVRPMLGTTDGSLIALSTPAGKRGWFHEAWISGEGWHRVRVPASECPVAACVPVDKLSSMPNLINIKTCDEERTHQVAG